MITPPPPSTDIICESSRIPNNQTSTSHLLNLQVFYAFSSLLHAFHLESADPESELPSLEPIAGVTLTPRPFEISLRPRNDFAAVAETQLNMPSNYFSMNARTYG